MSIHDGEFMIFTKATAMGGKTQFLDQMVNALQGTTAAAGRLDISFKASSDSLNKFLEGMAHGQGRFPVNVTAPARPPKKRRHARGGLRPMVAASTRKFIAHGVSMKGDNTGAPWTFTMPVTRASR